jgi:hypothetical protein
MASREEICGKGLMASATMVPTEDERVLISVRRGDGTWVGIHIKKEAVSTVKKGAKPTTHGHSRARFAHSSRNTGTSYDRM